MYNLDLAALSTKLILFATTTDETEKQQLKKEIAEFSQQENRDIREEFLKFTDKEISKMPKQFRKIFRIEGHKVHVRERRDGRYNHSYEIRYAKKPFNNPPISASGTTIVEAKTRFIEKLHSYVPHDENAPTVPKDFDGFAMYWFENFHKRKVGEATYKQNLSIYKRNIQKAFEHMRLSEILPVQIQNFLEEFNDKARTKETIHSILNQIFVCAVKHGIIKLNPLDMCFYQKHERKHGQAIPKAEEKKLLSTYAGTPFLLDFVIPLYTGLRPNEYATATIDGNFIKANNSKRKNGRTAFKRIPISPMLKPYLAGMTELKLHHPDTIAEKFKKILPNFTLYDMRTTFQTRCTECGVAEVAIGLFMGNAIGGELKKAYTDVSDEWLLNEGKKLNY